MKQKLILFFTLIASFSFFACEDDNEICPDDNSNSQVVFAYAEYNNHYHERVHNSSIYKDNVKFEGTVTGKQITELYSLKCNDTIFQDNEYFKKQAGFVIFGERYDSIFMRTFSDLDTLDVDIYSTAFEYCK